MTKDTGNSTDRLRKPSPDMTKDTGQGHRTKDTGQRTHDKGHMTKDT